MTLYVPQVIIDATAVDGSVMKVDNSAEYTCIVDHIIHTDPLAPSPMTPLSAALQHHLFGVRGQ